MRTAPGGTYQLHSGFLVYATKQYERLMNYRYTNEELMIKWNMRHTSVNNQVLDRVPAVDRREVSRVFRVRLSEAMARAGVSQAALARRAGISRSTLAQLLSPEVNRLPRADTVAAVAMSSR